MAGLRLIAVVAITGCASAASQPAPPPLTRSGIASPDGWQAMPDLATAVTNAARVDGVSIEGSEAWGEPSRGCFAAWIVLRGGDGNLLIVDDMLASVAGEKIQVADVVKPTGDGIVTLSFARAPYKGKLRARIERGRVVALACFANDREPASCEASCTMLLGGVT